MKLLVGFLAPNPKNTYAKELPGSAFSAFLPNKVRYFMYPAPFYFAMRALGGFAGKMRYL
jgi:hypothetical protein